MDLVKHSGTIAPEILLGFREKVRDQRKRREEVEAARRAEEEREESKKSKSNRPYDLLKRLVKQEIASLYGDPRMVQGFSANFDIGIVEEGLRAHLMVEAKVSRNAAAEDGLEINEAFLHIFLSTDDGIAEEYPFARYRNPSEDDMEPRGNIVPGFFVADNLAETADFPCVTLDSPAYGLLTEVLAEALEPVPQAA